LPPIKTIDEPHIQKGERVIDFIYSLMKKVEYMFTLAKRIILVKYINK